MGLKVQPRVSWSERPFTLGTIGYGSGFRSGACKLTGIDFRWQYS